ncbi:MAG: NYN domain-containing protein [Gomphosphaeria aponina SAG 52.96 = DSM 107014]|uniref:NYN domain-containing protein n=1 Tax=Gomphosphaeria aponina SAG 52.96 = DSM 107014 TaxID=1521640 RepID=A0A941GUG1_9CHRO|nr:NYN domain-containing protein [Gomphosphaeria aponina SAG 52.96 = DSM 107014]
MSSSSLSQVLLLVDGYNIIGSWQCLKVTRDRYGLELARQELIEALINYSAFQGYKTNVVFDSQYRRTPTQSENFSTFFTVHYTAFNQTADTYIEKFCAEFHGRPQPPSPRIIVATSDRAQQLTVVGYGAEWISAQRLEGEVCYRSNRAKKPNQRPQKQCQGRFLFNSLDAKTQQRLVQMRTAKS